MLHINHMYKDEDKVIFYVKELTKTSRPSFDPEPLQFLSFPEDQNICVLLALNTYIDEARSARGDCTKLSISVKTPHKPVQTCTVSRWIKASLELI